MRKYYPEGKLDELYNIYGYTLAQAIEEVLRRAGDNLTRENIMQQAASLKGLELPMLLPGITINTSPNDYATIKEAYMSRFDGTRWVIFGERLQAP